MKPSVRFEQKPDLRPIRLDFRNPHLERSFRHDYGRRTLSQSRVALLLGAALYVGLGIQDPWFFPHAYWPIWFMRLAATGLILGVFVSTFRPLFRRFGQEFLLAVSLVAGFGPIGMILLGDADVGKAYYVGLILVVVWGYSFSGLRFANALAANLLLVTGYAAILDLSNPPAVWLFTNISNLIAASLLVGFAGYLIERQRRALFFQSVLIESERRSHEQLALSDHLTGLPNRIYLERRMEEAIARAQRHRQVLAVLFIDIDGFKPVNDTYGHRAGDNVLCVLARGLEEALRANDTVARVGGDEFVVLLEDVANRDKATKVAEKIGEALAQPVVVATRGGGSATVQVSASIGVALFPADGDSARALIQQADQAMYEEKRVKRADEADKARFA